MLSGGPWDYVVLQDQSQTPGGGQRGDGLWTLGEAKARSERALLNFYAPRIDAAAVLYATWGHHSGDANNSDVYPDFPTMTKSRRPATSTRLFAEAFGWERRPDDCARRRSVPVLLERFRVPRRPRRERGFRACLITPPTRRRVRLSYYDHMHPSLLGTYLTAALFAATIHAQPLDQVKWAPEGTRRRPRVRARGGEQSGQHERHAYSKFECLPIRC